MDQKNLVLAIAASLAILLGFEYFISGPQREAELRRQAAIEATTGDAAPSASTAPTPGATGAQPGAGAPTGDTSAERAESRAAAIEAVERVAIETPTLIGSISLQGGRMDDLTLRQYRETLDPESPLIDLFSPPGAPKPYYATFGWASTESDIGLPQEDTVWESSGGPLTPDNPVVLTWDNGAGLTFERRFEVDEHYVFTVTQRVVNSGEEAVNLSAYGLISRTGTPPTSGFFILHEGLIGVIDGTLKEIDYDDLQDDGQTSFETTGGWLGITDKYWMATLVPDQSKPINARFVHVPQAGAEKYQTDYLYAADLLQPGAEIVTTSRLFAGAKQVLLLDSYEQNLGIPNFDLAVDFGWFYFLTKPIFLALHWIADQVGNFGVAILILTVGLKLLFFPLANKSYKSMAKMRKLQPEMLKLRERFGDDKQRLNQEMMALYKKEGANPLAGCLPVLLQIPVFFALYKVLFVTLEMRQAPFFGWIQDLSAPDPTSILNLFGLLPFEVPDLGLLNIISLGIWPLLMGISMFVQQKLNPQPADPMQARIFAFMPIVFTFMLAQFPAGLVIYWTWNNTLSVIQQYVIMKRLGVPIGGKMNFPGMPKAPAEDKGGASKKAKGERDGEGSTPESEAEDSAEGPAPSTAKPRERKRTAGKGAEGKGARGSAAGGKQRGGGKRKTQRRPSAKAGE